MQKITTNTIQKIADTIPISIYTKSNLYTFKIDTSASTSYIDFNEFKIHISINNINDALSNLNKEPSALELERIIRGLVYHETAHALLTPKKYLELVYKYSNEYFNNTIVNILEDERIETILKNHFLNTDFIANKKLILQAPSKQQMMQDFTSFVFGVARCDVFKEYYKYIIKMIKETATMNEVGCIYNATQECARSLYLEWQKLQQQNNNERKQETAQNNAQNQNANENTTKQENRENSQNNANESAMQESNKNNNETSAQENQNENENENGSGANENETTEEINESEMEQTASETIAQTIREKEKESAKKHGRQDNHFNRELLNNYNYKHDAILMDELIKIIARGGGFGTAKHYTGGGYSGQFKTNNYIKDLQRAEPNYKWFNNRQKQSEKTNDAKIKKLNIILDNSSSFTHNDETASEIIKTLCDIEKITAFKFRLFILDNEFQEVKNEHRVSLSSGTGMGGTMAILIKELAPQFQEITKERTIFLTDGSLNEFCDIACSAYHRNPKKCDDALKQLNREKVAIISNGENIALFEKNELTRCKITISDNYTDELKKNIKSAFEFLYK